MESPSTKAQQEFMHTLGEHRFHKVTRLKTTQCASKESTDSPKPPDMHIHHMKYSDKEAIDGPIKAHQSYKHARGSLTVNQRPIDAGKHPSMCGYISHEGRN